jgi:hypothetical protein
MPRGVSIYDEARLQGRLWTPTAIASGLRLFCDFGDLSRLTVDSGSGGITSTARNIAAGMINTGTRPSYATNGFNGRISANFNGANQGMRSDTSTTFTVPAVAVIAGAWTTATSNGGRLLTYASVNFDGGHASGCIIAMRNGTGSPGQVVTYNQGAIRATTNSVIDGNPLVFSVVFGSGASASVAHYFNGAAGGTGNLSGFSPAAGRYLMARFDESGSGAANITGPYGSAVVYCGDDAAAWRTRIEGWTAWRWGIQSRLAASHPYRNAPPLIGG